MINPDVENKIAQELSYNSALGRLIKEKAANILADRKFSQLPGGMQATAEEIIQAFLLNKGDSIGWEDPGANYMVMANAIASSGNGSPLNVLTERGKSAGAVTGYGTVHSGVARQLTNWIEDRTFNKYGERRNDITGGLGTAMQSGMVGQFLMERGGLKAGEVIQTQFSSDADAMQEQLNALKERGVDMKSQDVQNAMRAQYIMNKKKEFESRNSNINYEVHTADNAALAAQNELAHAQDNGADKETLKKLSAKVQELMRKQRAVHERRDELFANEIVGTRVKSSGDRDSFKVTSEDMENAGRALEGKMGGVFVTDGLKKEMATMIDRNKAIVNELGEIFGTKSFTELQAAVKQLGMGSLTSQRDVQEVKKRVADAKAIALQTNRSVQEVMQEQADVATAFSNVFGGNRMNSSTITRIMNNRNQAQVNYEKGMSTKTAEEIVAEENQNMQADSNIMGGVAVAMREREVRGIKDEELNKWIDTALSATTSSEQKVAARQVERLMRKRGLGKRIDDPGERKRAMAQYSEQITGSRARLAAQEDVAAFEISDYTANEAASSGRYADRADEFAENAKKKKELRKQLDTAVSSTQRNAIKAEMKKIGPTSVKEAIREDMKDAALLFGNNFEHIKNIQETYRTKGVNARDEAVEAQVKQYKMLGMDDEDLDKMRKVLTSSSEWTKNQQADYEAGVNNSRNIHELGTNVKAIEHAYSKTQSVMKELKEKEWQGEDKTFVESVIAGLQSNPDNKNERTDKDNMLRYFERSGALSMAEDGTKQIAYGTLNTSALGQMSNGGRMAAMEVNMETGEITNTDVLIKNDAFMSMLEESMNVDGNNYSRDELVTMLKDPTKRADILTSLKDKMTYTGKSKYKEGNGNFVLADEKAKQFMREGVDTELEEGRKWHLDSLGEHLGNVQHNEDGTISNVTIDGITYNNKKDVEEAIATLADKDSDVRDRLRRNIDPNEDAAFYDRLNRKENKSRAQNLKTALNNNSTLMKALQATEYDANAQTLFSSEEEWRATKQAVGAMTGSEGAHYVKKVGESRYNAMINALDTTGKDQDTGRAIEKVGDGKNKYANRLTYIGKKAFKDYEQESEEMTTEKSRGNIVTKDTFKFNKEGELMRKTGDGWEKVSITSLSGDVLDQLEKQTRKVAKHAMRQGHLNKTLETRVRAINGEQLEDWEMENALMKRNEDGGFEVYNSWDDYKKGENGRSISGKDVRHVREAGTGAASLVDNVSAAKDEKDSDKEMKEAMMKLAGCVGADGTLQVSIPNSQPSKGQ